MTNIVSSSVTAVNSGKFTASIWFRFQDYPTQGSGWFAPSFVDLLAWKNPANNPQVDTSSPGNSCIAISQGLDAIKIFLISTPMLQSGGVSIGGASWYNSFWKATSLTDQGIGSFLFDTAFIELDISLGPGAPSPTPIQLLTWNHLFVSADASIADSFVFGGPSILTLNKKPNVYLNRTDILYGIGTSGENQIRISAPNVGLIVGNTYPLPGFNVDISGCAAGQTTLAEGADTPNYGATSPAIELANTQVWFGQCVAPTMANLDKFVLLDGGGNPILPPDIRAAQDAFGQSDIWFVRDNISDIKFEENRGTAGPFTVIGTDPVDFQPGPVVV